MKASLIYCQATDGSFAHTLQNTPTLHLKSHRDTQVSFLHVYCQCCNLWVCVCVRRLQGSDTRWSTHLRVRWGRRDHRHRSNTSHWCRCPRFEEFWTCRTLRVTQRQHTHTLQNKDAAAHHFVCMSFQGVFSSCNTAQCWKPRQANSGRSHFPVCSFKNALRSESAAKHHLIPEVYFRRVPQQT